MRNFFLEADPAIHELGRKLADEKFNDAALTIAIDSTAKDVIVPWSLFYDQRPPVSFGEVADPSRFWGVRFRITIRPHGSIGVSLSPGDPLTVGTVYGKHTKRLRKRHSSSNWR